MTSAVRDLVPAAASAVDAAPTGAGPVAASLLSRLDAERPVLAELPVRERLLAAAWLGSYRSARIRRVYAGDLAAWLDWLHEIGVDVLHARRVHVDLWVRQLLDAGAASSSTARRLSALSSFYRHLGEHDLIAANPAAAVRRPTVDPDHTATVGLDRDQARAFLAAAAAAADTDTGPARLRTAAAARLLLHLGLRVDELGAADVTDLGHDRGHRVLTVTRKGGRRATVVLPPPTAAALDTYLADRAGTAAGPAVGPLLATASGGRLDQGALWKLVRRLARAALDQLDDRRPGPDVPLHAAVTGGGGPPIGEPELRARGGAAGRTHYAARHSRRWPEAQSSEGREIDRER